MPNLLLFVAPNTCARVPTIALEEAGAPFATQLVRTAIGEQDGPAFRKLNPKGKVPTLLVDGAPLTENVAILSWLAATFPDARLMPEGGGPLEAARRTADLAFFAGTVHPLVTRIAMPVKLIEDAALSFEIVRPKGMAEMAKVLSVVEARLADGPWWYGADWSVVDGYLYWAWTRITGVGFPEAGFPNIRRHRAAMDARPAVQRAMAREAADVAVLEREGNYRAPR